MRSHEGASSDRSGSDSHIKTLGQLLGQLLLRLGSCHKGLLLGCPSCGGVQRDTSSPQCGHSIRKIGEGALPDWASGEAAVKQVLWDL